MLLLFLIRSRWPHTFERDKANTSAVSHCYYYKCQSCCAISLSNVELPFYYTVLSPPTDPRLVKVYTRTLTLLSITRHPLVTYTQCPIRVTREGLLLNLKWPPTRTLALYRDSRHILVTFMHYLRRNRCTHKLIKT